MKKDEGEKVRYTIELTNMVKEVFFYRTYVSNYNVLQIHNDFSFS